MAKKIIKPNNGDLRFQGTVFMSLIFWAMEEKNFKVFFNEETAKRALLCAIIKHGGDGRIPASERALKLNARKLLNKKDSDKISPKLREVLRELLRGKNGDSWLNICFRGMEIERRNGNKELFLTAAYTDQIRAAISGLDKESREQCKSIAKDMAEFLG